MTFYRDRGAWLAKAEELAPQLRREFVQPQCLAGLRPDAAAFRGVLAEPAGPVAEADESPWKQGDARLFDFASHVVGRLQFHLASGPVQLDAPVRLKIECGEVASELAGPFDNYAGGLCRSWLQDEVVNIDHPGPVTLPRFATFG